MKYSRRLGRPAVAGALAAAVAVVTASSPALASATAAPSPPRVVYAMTFATNSVLYRLHPRSHGVTRLGRAGAQLTDIAFRGRVLYAISFTNLYRVNPGTGAARDIGYLGITSAANALVARPKTGILYGADQYGNFFKINPRTGRATAIGAFGHGLGSVGDLAFMGSHLYAAVYRPGSTASYLAVVNVRTGAAKVIGKIGFANVYGLVAGHGALYGATFGGRFIVISATTGHGRRLWSEGVRAGGLAAP